VLFYLYIYMNLYNINIRTELYIHEDQLKKDKILYIKHCYPCYR